MTGELIGGMFEKFVAAIASTGIISDLSQLPTQRQMVLKMAGEKAISSSLNIYKESMTPLVSQFPVEEVALFQVHEKAATAAKSAFLTEVGSEDEVPK